ncbi:MAG: 3-oxoacyl-ACP synthase [Cyclobacteriaceae bacterium]|nr:3-oxoacyl-ACP synthase [Cytophagales bacterium]MBX2899400.1 3-oxoacyl-ACP synthase [Cyclobacteriaceae bacterium]
MDLRKTLYEQCLAYAEARIKAAQEAMQLAQEAANAEEKSSAGDKYETGRAMAHLEKEKAFAQLAEGNKLKAALSKVEQGPTSKVALGSVVHTNTGNYYLAISAGKLIVANKEYLALSPASPLGAQFIGCTVGATITFQGKSILILAIE